MQDLSKIAEFAIKEALESAIFDDDDKNPRFRLLKGPKADRRRSIPRFRRPVLFLSDPVTDEVTHHVERDCDTGQHYLVDQDGNEEQVEP